MIYLNHAALCPTLPEAEQEAAKTITEVNRYLYSDAGIEWYLKKVQDCRQKVAALLHVSNPATIAFVSNASTAHYLILSSLNWKAGDSILTTTHENPSITRQLLALKSQGVQIHTISPTSPEKFIKDFKQQIRSNHIKAIVMSHVSHVDGRIFPMHDISELAKESNCLLIIDGAQAAGHIGVDLSVLSSDVYLFTGHKWCRGPLGTGAMVVRDSFFQHSDYQQIQVGKPGFPPTSQFEIGTHNIGLIAGLAQACEHKALEGGGTEKFLWFRKKAKELIAQHSDVNLVEWDGPHAPGILTIQGKPGFDHQKLAKQLAEESQIIVKLFSDYPEDIMPALRLSWSATMDEGDFRIGVGKVLEGFA